jgi:Ni/Fe-hydrogenase subunit HybB-like protein
MNLSRPVAYVPTAMEIRVSLAIVTMGVVTFRWIVNRLPVLREDAGYRASH